MCRQKKKTKLYIYVQTNCIIFFVGNMLVMNFKKDHIIRTLTENHLFSVERRGTRIGESTSVGTTRFIIMVK